MTFRTKFVRNGIGDLYLTATARGISGVYFEQPPGWPGVNGEDDDPDADDAGGLAAAAHLARAADQLGRYSRGSLRAFDLELDVIGTPFQRRVWAELMNIPFGQTRSYRDVARALGTESACRAVGTANGRNPVCIVVPCHRVIAADGTLGGYSGGLPIKRALLTLEGRPPRDRPLT